MQKINFQDLPSTATPINATNLNAIQTNAENAINSIIESGSNANGNWIKYSDGTMICYTTKILTTAITSAWGVLYESSSAIDLGSFPQNFISTPIVTGTINTMRSAFIESIYGTSTTSWGNTYLVRPQSSNENTYGISLIAIGKWK